MNRRSFLKSLGAAGITASTAGLLGRFAKEAKADPPTQPNVILILIDDMGWMDIGCYCLEYGNDYYETPNIDSIRADGMKFTDAYATCCVCSPTRVSVTTGRYPTRCGITDWLRASNPTNREYLCPALPDQMPLEDVTIAEILKTVGYETCHIGKWHLGETEPYYPQHQGFDHNIGGCWWGQPKNGYFSPYGFPSGAGLPDGPTGEYLTDREGEEALTFIENAHNAGNPFFLYLAHHAVHKAQNQLQAKQSDITYFQNKPKPAEPRYSNLSPNMAAMIKAIDDAIGGILTKLNDLGIADNTIIIFTSDNGGLTETVHYPLTGSKAHITEGGIREPFLVKWPGVVTPNSLSHEPVISVDLLPTISEMAGVRVPEGVVIDGVSLVPILKQTGPLNRDSLFWHYPHYNQDLPASMIRCGDWKLIKRYGGSKEFELFNLKDDISETTDLAPQMPEKVKELHEKLTAWLRETNAKIPTRNPNYGSGIPAESTNVQIG